MVAHVRLMVLLLLLLLLNGSAASSVHGNQLVQTRVVVVSLGAHIASVTTVAVMIVVPLRSLSGAAATAHTTGHVAATTTAGGVRNLGC